MTYKTYLPLPNAKRDAYFAPNFRLLITKPSKQTIDSSIIPSAYIHPNTPRSTQITFDLHEELLINPINRTQSTGIEQEVGFEGCASGYGLTDK